MMTPAANHTPISFEHYARSTRSFAVVLLSGELPFLKEKNGLSPSRTGVSPIASVDETFVNVA